MIILIDGYNLLRYVFPKAKGELDRQRTQFIKLLGYYKQKKQEVIKEIIVVFDAGPFRHASREIHSGITVMFSGQKSNADEWIIAYVKRHKEYEIALITRDRALKESCKQYGVMAIDIDDFYSGVKALLQEKKEEQVLLQGDIVRYDDDNFYLDTMFPDVDEDALHIMMTSMTTNCCKDESNDVTNHKQKGSAYTVAKKDKKRSKVLKKLR